MPAFFIVDHVRREVRVTPAALLALPITAGLMLALGAGLAVLP